MVLWLALSLLLALTLGVLLRPLFVPPRAVAGGDDREVFAAQLDELEADKRRGLIGEAEAEAARAEIARRLLRARGPREAAASPRRRRYGVALALAVFVPLFSVGTYLMLGTPRYGDQPLAARLAPITETELAGLVAQAEAELAANPDDGRGWVALAPVYQRLRRFDDAAKAYAEANRLLGPQPEWMSLQAENLTFAGDGTVSEEAKTLFEEVLRLKPDALRPAIFLAIADRQAGDIDAAAARWQALLANSTGNEPWLPIAQAELAGMGLTPPAASPPTGGATASTPEGGATASAPEGGTAGVTPSAPATTPAAIEAMVAGLAQRLQSQGGSAAEWVRLVRSYTVLGRVEDARATVEQALAALDGPERDAFAAAPDVARLTQ